MFEGGIRLDELRRTPEEWVTILDAAREEFEALRSVIEPRSRMHALEARLFIQGVARDATVIGFDEIVTRLDRRMRKPGTPKEVSEVLRRVLDEMKKPARFIGAQRVFLDDDGSRGDLEGVGDAKSVPEMPQRAATIPLTDRTRELGGERQFGMAGDLISLHATSFAPKELSHEAREAHERDMRVQERAARRRQLEKKMDDAREYARRYYKAVFLKEPSFEVLQGHVDDVSLGLVEDAEALRDQFGFDASLIRRPLSEAFFEAFFFSLDQAGLRHEIPDFTHLVDTHISHRARLAMLLGFEREVAARERPPKKAWEVLGVASSASVDEVERVYASRLSVLDPDVPEDRAVIAALHKAREAMIRTAVFEEWEEAPTDPGRFVPMSTSADHPPVNLSVEPEDLPMIDAAHVLPLGVADSQALSEGAPRTHPMLPDSQHATWVRESDWDEGSSASTPTKQHPHSPFELLGVSERATRSELDAALQKKLAEFDPDKREDRADIAALQRAYASIVPVERRAQSDVPAPSKDARPENHEDGVFTRMLRAPGRAIYGLFGALAFAGGAALAVHEFPENEADQEKVEDTRSEHASEDVADVDTGVSIEDDPATLKAASGEQKHLTPESLRFDGDTTWNVVIDMLRDRGLSTSGPQVQYFTHRALEESGYTALDAMRLKVGDRLNLQGIAREMDQLAGGDAASEPVVAKGSEVLPFAPELPGVLRGYGMGNDEDWNPTFSAESMRPTWMHPERATGKAYEDLPTAEHTTHVTRKGENPSKMVHHMLRSRGLNWTTERINFLAQMVVDQNADRFRALVRDGAMKKMSETWIPVGAELDYSNVIAVLDEMQRAKAQGKKAKTVKQLAAERGYTYPIMMKFPEE